MKKETLEKLEEFINELYQIVSILSMDTNNQSLCDRLSILRIEFSDRINEEIQTNKL